MGIGTLTLNLERYRVVDYATFFFWRNLQQS